MASMLDPHSRFTVVPGTSGPNPANKAAIRARPGWDAIRHVYEIKSTYVLQPGPAALTEGVRQLHAILAHAVGSPVAADLLPGERLDPDLRESRGSIN
jgi:hypothetical protein